MSITNAENTENMGSQLLIVFMSLVPKNCSRREVLRRINDYQVALKQLGRIMPRSWEAVLCENTLKENTQKLEHYLEIDLSRFNISMLSSNSGGANKGIGELDMMVKALEDYPQQTNRAKTISYLTGRRLVTNQYIFERANKLVAEALVSNPDFYYLDGTLVPVEKKGMYNDMFFSMKSARFFEYADYFKANRQRMIEAGVGSEQNLYNFVNEKKLSIEWLDTLGFIRREKHAWLKWFSQDKIHVC